MLPDLKFLYAPENVLDWTKEMDVLFHALRDTCLKEINKDAWSGIIVRKLSENLNMQEELLTILLNDDVVCEDQKCKVVEVFKVSSWFETPSSPPLDFLQIIDWLYQWATFVNRFQLTTNDVSLILLNGVKNGWYRPLLKGLQTDNATQNFVSWKMFITACTLNSSFRKKDNPSLFQVISDNREWADKFPAASEEELSDGQEKFLIAIAKITNWNLDDLRYLTNNIHQWKYPFDFLDMKWFDRLSQDFRFLIRNGLLPSQIPQMQSMAFYNIDAAQVDILQMALKSKTPPGQWNDKLEQLGDQVREGQLNALQTYLLSRDPGLENEDDIYALYLVDTE
ncbi:MAG TPA: hypothetical protein VFJ43_04270, partial [Bacteroidia bacterium]|nr:hypothetical protein [Bacteroidia bacterium]